MISIVLTGLALRIIFALVLPLDGGDEAYTLLASQQPIGPLLAATLDASGPAWTLILHFIEKVTTDFHLIRMIPSIIGTISIVFAAKLGSTLFNKKTGQLTALIAALSPTQIYYSAHSRQYSLTILTSLLIFLALTRFLKSDSQKNTIFLFIILTAANYIHYLAIIIPAGFLIYLYLFETRQKLTKFTKIFLLSVVASIPIYLAFLSVEHLPKAALPNVTLLKIATLPLNFTLPLNLAELTGLYPKFALNYTNLLLLALSSFAVAIISFSVIKKTDKKVSFLISTFALPNIMVIVFSATVTSIFGFRTLLIFATPLYLLLGFALVTRKRLTAIYLTLTAVALVSTIYYFLNKPYPLEDFLKSNLKSADILINTEFTNYTYLAYLMPQLQHKAAIDTLYKTAADKKLFNYYPVDNAILKGQTFWLLEQPTMIHKIMVENFKDKLAKTHQIIFQQSFDDMLLYKYQPKN